MCSGILKLSHCSQAKLPCGIRNIRPHLEQVDNVPLLVSLFTDCTSDTTEQMLAIMQEYGQVVCVLGSSANIKNFPLFAQANARYIFSMNGFIYKFTDGYWWKFFACSISVEPLYAQVCQQIPSSFMDDVNEKRCFSPTELSHLLNSLPCSLILQRNYDYHRILPIYPLIAEVAQFDLFFVFHELSLWLGGFVFYCSLVTLWDRCGIVLNFGYPASQ